MDETVREVDCCATEPCCEIERGPTAELGVIVRLNYSEFPIKMSQAIALRDQLCAVLGKP